MVKTKLGQWIKNTRKSRGYTQWQLAYICNVDPTYISKIENGKTKYLPSYELLESLSVALKVEFDEVLQYAGYYDQQKLSQKAAEIPLLGNLLNSLQESADVDDLIKRVDVWHRCFYAKGILKIEDTAE